MVQGDNMQIPVIPNEFLPEGIITCGVETSKKVEAEIQRLTQLCEEQGRTIKALTATTQAAMTTGKLVITVDDATVKLDAAESALSQAREEVDGMEEKHGEELRRWQDEIRGAVIDASGASDCDIDGGGCDSGDPLDLTLTEISQGFVFLKEAAEQREKGLREALERIASGELGVGMFPHRNIDRADMKAIAKAALAAASEVGE